MVTVTEHLRLRLGAVVCISDPGTLPFPRGIPGAVQSQSVGRIPCTSRAAVARVTLCCSIKLRGRDESMRRRRCTDAGCSENNGILRRCGWSRRRREREGAEGGGGGAVPAASADEVQSSRSVRPAHHSIPCCRVFTRHSRPSGIENEHILFRSISPERSARERVRVRPSAPSSAACIGLVPACLPTPYPEGREKDE